MEPRGITTLRQDSVAFPVVDLWMHGIFVYTYDMQRTESSS